MEEIKIFLELKSSRVMVLLSFRVAVACNNRFKIVPIFLKVLQQDSYNKVIFGYTLFHLFTSVGALFNVFARQVQP